MLSSKDGLFDKARGRMVGSQEYLTKPFTKEQLLRAVETFRRKAP
jgi:twitching motility two-component system response regulator PilG